MKTLEKTLLEITKEQAIKTYNEGKVIYIQCSGVHPDTAFNTFIMRNDAKDASLNIHLYGRAHKDIPLHEYIDFIERHQAEPVKYYTYNCKELIQLF